MNPLHERATSGFALTLPTGLAFETLFRPQAPVYDPERPVPQRPQLTDYNELWVNVGTLIRNIYDSVSRDVTKHIKPEDMMEVIYQEIDVISSLCLIEGNGLLQPRFYFNKYKDFLTNKKVFAFREDRTLIQKQARYVYEMTQSLVLRNSSAVEEFNLRLKGQGKAAIILTHIPIDLLSSSNFSRLDLLESYTGVIKNELKWGTKYYPIPDEDMGRYPFCRQLLTALGDKVLLSPLPIKARKEIAAIAKENRWSPMTSKFRVSTDLAKLKDPFLAGVLKAVPIN